MEHEGITDLKLNMDVVKTGERLRKETATPVISDGSA
jgi:hypothetical protein